jgi:hypothetical protein
MNSAEQRPSEAGIYSVNELPAFYGTRDNTQCIPDPATGYCPEPDESNAQPTILQLEVQF